MSTFIHDDFLLLNEPAKRLYHHHAKDKPIIDFHCHLPPDEIAEDKQFSNISEIWLHGDHYKWRAMRAFGVDEKYITGHASDMEKFREWAKVVPKTLGNPLYHWTHMELKQYFGIDELLSGDNWKEIWDFCNTSLSKQEQSVRGLIKQSNVEVICTTDDPVDDLVHHEKINSDRDFSTQVLPTFRPDAAIAIKSPSFNRYMSQLGDAAEITIKSFQDLKKALERRVDYFHKKGCRLSDHGPQRLPFAPATEEEVAGIFLKGMAGQTLSSEETAKYQTFLFVFLGKLYHSKKWTMQLHIGALRDNNERMFKQTGANAGFDSIDDFSLAKPLNLYLNELDRTDELPKTIIYNLNPNHNEIVASTIGNFHTGNESGKVQFGSGWWFNDQKRGMERQLNDLAHFSFLSNFVGMLTDSRSFLSFTRHDYFRRILCQLIGEWVENGEVPDSHLNGKMAEDISYYNAREFFNW